MGEGKRRERARAQQAADHAARPFYLAPHGEGTQVTWVMPHGEDAWEDRKDQVESAKEQVERLLVAQVPPRPDDWKDDRLGRINRWIRLPNSRLLLVALDIVREATTTQPGAIEVVTLFVH